MNTVLLALTFPLHRAGLRRLLTEAGYSVIGEVPDLAAAAAPDAMRAEFVIVDASLYVVDADVLSRLRQTMGDLVVILAHADDLRRLTLDQIAAVDGVISFDATAETLVQSLRLVRAGERVFPRELMQSLITQGAPEPGARPLGRRALLKDLPRLSPREADMLRCLVRGCSDKVIAHELSITDATVKVHLKGLFRKLRVANRTQAALWAHKHGYDASEG